MTLATERLERTQQAMERECRKFIKEAYGLELDIPVLINNRLSRALGRFIRKGDRAYKIEFAGILVNNATDEQIISVLKHECIHFALFKLGRAFRDGQSDFENELRKHGSDSTNCIHVKRKVNMNLYSCDCKVHQVRRKLTGLYSCKHCKGDLKYEGKKEVMA